MARMKLPNEKAIVDALGGDLRPWAKRCHEASLTVVRAGVLPAGARVARGWHPEVTGQHSWVVCGNPYDKNALIVDPTIWCYRGDNPSVHLGGGGKGRFNYHPHGEGSIWKYGRPDEPKDEIITLAAELSPLALHFLRHAAPNGLDYRGWSVLANSPVGGWPAAEIINAMADDDRIAACIPIDVLGMLTDRNPGGFYK